LTPAGFFQTFHPERREGSSQGAAIPAPAAALLPVITVSTPVVVAGAAIGAIIAHKNGPK
jgi:hypothetical protein